MAENAGITRETVEHLAGLARITLSEEETTTLTAQLGQILGAIAKVSEVAGADVPATSHPVPLRNVSRPDEVRDVLTQEQALQNAPAHAAGKFQVTAILGEEQ
ncbi:Asp-tRNA(Asn)/Glu-tRNA(Gln) amidotransferase subunit GatC [Canibacter oris]|uniref:Aspartyl/glutamyl-tRNA(Asn/Gln) amidotransferase subunit C n=1 Tax=Canibacter oris TaxID=1365628 RepID=A0A840DL46_9MICO|nr:Asp-tRNA(Asn)/Glu-tRNA(Gln) amidotransferase subunit GatC [Canibacter oris]MBB4070818.1 aspartyl-tRNA(Asn)/glutamyl-tRNA(Gln) amidotransferase subunit C [Canibacter oris]